MKTHDEIASSVKERVSEETAKREIYEMKRKRVTISAICCLALIAISVICVKNGNSDIATVPETNLTQENEHSTVNASPEEYDFSLVIKAKNKDIKDSVNGYADMISPFKNNTELFKYSDNVIKGRVISTETILDKRLGVNVYTKSIVSVEKSYKGKAEIGEKVCVFEFGGFISSKEYSQAIELDKFGRVSEYEDNDEIIDIRLNGEKVLEEGESVILFLKEPVNSESDDLFEACYSITRVFQGKLLYNEEQGVYAPYVPEEELSLAEHNAYTEEGFEEFVSSIK